MQVPGLHSFFRRHIHNGFNEQGLAQPALVEYVSDLLTRFARVSVLYPFHTTEGRTLETIAGLLMALQSEHSNEKPKPGRARETLMLRHIADYALFMSGVFRDRLKYRGQFLYYLEQGQNAYARCARLESSLQHAAVLRRVCRDFGPISNVLDQIWHQRLPVPPNTDLSPLAAFWRA